MPAETRHTPPLCKLCVYTLSRLVDMLGVQEAVRILRMVQGG
jgi:hypothetical protein